jgi:hypothetical protein
MEQECGIDIIWTNKFSSPLAGVQRRGSVCLLTSYSSDAVEGFNPLLQLSRSTTPLDPAKYEELFGTNRSILYSVSRFCNRRSPQQTDISVWDCSSTHQFRMRRNTAHLDELSSLSIGSWSAEKMRSQPCQGRRHKLQVDYWM